MHIFINLTHLDSWQSDPSLLSAGSLQILGNLWNDVSLLRVETWQEKLTPGEAIAHRLYISVYCLGKLVLIAAQSFTVLYQIHISAKDFLLESVGQDFICATHMI